MSTPLWKVELDNIDHNILATILQKRECELEYERRIQYFNDELKRLSSSHLEINEVHLHCK